MLSLAAVAHVAVPHLNFSARTLLFEYFYHPLMERPPEKVQLSVANDGMVPLNASLKSQAPFDVTPQSLQLAPGSSSHVTVTMNHTYRKDLLSHKPKCEPSTTLQTVRIWPWQQTDHGAHSVQEEACDLFCQQSAF